MLADTGLDAAIATEETRLAELDRLAPDLRDRFRPYAGSSLSLHDARVRA